MYSNYCIWQRSTLFLSWRRPVVVSWKRNWEKPTSLKSWSTRGCFLSLTLSNAAGRFWTLKQPLAFRVKGFFGSVATLCRRFSREIPFLWWTESALSLKLRGDGRLPTASCGILNPQAISWEVLLKKYYTWYAFLWYLLNYLRILLYHQVFSPRKKYHKYTCSTNRAPPPLLATSNFHASLAAPRFNREAQTPSCVVAIGTEKIKHFQVPKISAQFLKAWDFQRTEKCTLLGFVFTPTKTKTDSTRFSSEFPDVTDWKTKFPLRVELTQLVALRDRHTVGLGLTY